MIKTTNDSTLMKNISVLLRPFAKEIFWFKRAHPALSKICPGDNTYYTKRFRFLGRSAAGEIYGGRFKSRATVGTKSEPFGFDCKLHFPKVDLIRC